MKRMELIRYNFSRLRKKQGWTQQICAEKGKTSNGYIGAIEAGLAKSFSAQAEEKWARIFGISIAEFFLEPGQIVINAQELMNKINKTEVSQIARDTVQSRQAELEKRFGKSNKKKIA